ncbi:DUF1648 domain-containing protein [Agrococcus sp. Marseille-P2731]|uniref:DUF1648 domain-containing protein n=1 Tax=Agrococcus sp. Marseille-P2731 TaxID=1841862 RepID=UPI00093097CD|nr:DUF1648 domain-containing protein [Agrococcus sp. Marseille-P2731]
MTRAARPARTYATGALTRVTRGIALLGSAATAAWLVLQYPSLPDVIPTHFGPGGEPDAWGSKASVLWLAGVALALAALVGWISTRPRSFNFPVPVTEQNAQRLYREGERTLVWLLAALTLVFAGLALMVTGAGGVALLVVGLAGTMASTLVGLVRLMIVTGR